MQAGDRVQQPAIGEIQLSEFDCGGDRFAILSLPELRIQLPDSLSAAEREVCMLLLSGASNASVAQQRRTSVRTVANQVAAILKKLHARSRAELPALVIRAGEP